MSVLPSDLSYYSAFYNPAYDGAATLNGAISSTTTTTLVINAPTAAFPASGEFAIQIDSEIMWVTQGAPGSSAGTLTVIRGFGGTTAATHSNAASVTMPIGGGPDFLRKLSFSDIGSSGDTASYVSSASGDTKPQITLTGRDTTGVIQSETKTLNGTTLVAGTQTWGRFEAASLAVGTTSTGSLTSGATSLTVTAATNFPSTGNYYIQMAKEVLQVTAGQGTTTWTVSRAQLGTTATAHNSGDSIYLLPVGDVAIVDSTKIISAHTAQTGSANPTGVTPALFKLQSGDGATVAVGQIIQTTGGTGPNQIRTIIATSGYGTDIVAVSRSWGTVPDNTTTYNVFDGIQLDLSPNQITDTHRVLWNAAAQAVGGSTNTFYEKAFVVNNNTSTALTSSALQVTSESPSLPGSATIGIALATSLNDTVTAVNRQTALASGYGSIITQPSSVTVTANSGTLPSGAAPNAAGALGIQFVFTLPAGVAAYNGYMNVQTSGTTT